jgi:hypothetical protein
LCRYELKAFERIAIGDVVPINSGSHSSLPIDRERAPASRQGHHQRRNRQYACQLTIRRFQANGARAGAGLSESGRSTIFILYRAVRRTGVLVLRINTVREINEVVKP